ncbi:MAG: acyl carrier protein [Thermodesulfobacteriota bacterium]|nr:acyl carrier protein [Thermodesulfobacteriota bacterium]
MMEVAKSHIIKIIKDAHISQDIDTLNHDAPLSENGVDSLDMANILLAIEEKYNIKIPDEDTDKLVSINAIAKYISNK